MMSMRIQPRPGTRPDGFAIVEAVISAMIVGLMLAAAVQLVGSSRTSQIWSLNRVRAFDLASQLMTEITELPYSDPDSVPVLFGPEGSELLAGRKSFDDVDDYAGLDDSPVHNRQGDAIPGYSGWTRQVEVAWVQPGDLTSAAMVETGLKRITVTVRREGIKVAELVSIRSASITR